MKRLFVTCITLVACVLLSAGTIDRKSAMQKAARMFGGTVAMQQVAMPAGDTPAYYVFNAQRSGNGFVIVAGEDMGDDILAFSDSGSFNPLDMPPALRWWLEQYRQQVEMVRSEQAAPHKAIVREAIAPLLKTKWNQNTPFNAALPVNPTKATLTYYEHTGCVATALAQVLKYHASAKPVSAIPEYSYSYQYRAANNTTATANVTVPGVEATTFDYAAMPNELYSTSDDGAAEVAKLMRYCGQAVKMNYYDDEAAAVLSAVPLATYFGYNPYSKEISRSDFTADSWDRQIYDELASRRPVLYRGQKHNNNGHAFVVDGYKDQLFHINWGWGGNYNGYFKLSECNPYGGGTGAGSGLDGYSFDQSAIVLVQPEATIPIDDVDDVMTVEAVSVSQTSYSRANTYSNFSIPVTFTVWNKTGHSQYFEIGLGVYDASGKIVDAYRFHGTELANNSGFRDNVLTVTFGNGLTSGTYYIRPICRTSTTASWVADMGSSVQSVKLEINGLTATAKNSVNMLTVNSVSISGVKKTNNTLTMTANVTNSGDMNTSSLFLFVNGSLASGAGVNFEAGQTDDVLIHFMPQQSGTLPLVLSIDREGTQPVWTGSVVIENRRDYNLLLDAAKVVNTEYDSALGQTVVRGTTLTASIDITNNDTSAFNDIVRALIFKYNPADGYFYSGDELIQEVNIAQGEKQTVSFDFVDLEVGSTYLVIFYLYDANGTPQQQKQTSYYLITEDTSGIVAVESVAGSSAAAVYDTKGRFVQRGTSGLPKGLYVVKGKKFVKK